MASASQNEQDSNSASNRANTDVAHGSLPGGGGRGRSDPRGTGPGYGYAGGRGRSDPRGTGPRYGQGYRGGRGGSDPRGTGPGHGGGRGRSGPRGRGPRYGQGYRGGRGGSGPRGTGPGHGGYRGRGGSDRAGSGRNSFRGVGGDGGSSQRTRMASQECQQQNCSAREVLGPQPGSIHQTIKDDPLKRFLSGKEYSMGSGIILQLDKAMEVHVKDVFEGKLGEPGKLLIHPDISNPGANQTWADVIGNSYSKMGVLGILKGHPNRAAVSVNQVKKRIIDKAEEQHKADEAEGDSLLAAIHAMEGNEGTIMHGRKSSLTLLEYQLGQATSLSPLERLRYQFGLIGITTSQENEVKEDTENLVKTYFSKLGSRSISDFDEAIGRQKEIAKNSSRRIKEEINKHIKILEEYRNEDQNGPSPSVDLDPFDTLLLVMMRKKLNQQKKEYDLNIIHPNFKTVMQAETKSTTSDANVVNQVVKEALKQLSNGKEEIKRAHGHVFDPQWSFFGLIMMPNLSSQDRDNICAHENICTRCKKFILVGDVENELKNIFSCHFTGTTKYVDAEWRPAYVDLVTRLVSFENMIPNYSSAHIIGTDETISGGISENDIFDLFGSNIAPELWKTFLHFGSPLRIMFMNKIQRIIWNEKKIAFLADYGVGKTTILMSKAISLSNMGQKVTIFCLQNYLKVDVEPVLAVWNKIKFATFPNITIISLLDLEKFYADNGGNAELVVREHSFIKISGMKLILRYIQKVSDSPQNIFIDEALIERMPDDLYKVNEDATVENLKDVSDHLTATSPNGHLWIAYYSERLLNDGDIPPVNRTYIMNKLNDIGFSVPLLQYNMRNSHEVASAAKAIDTPSEGMDPAIIAPRAPATLNPPQKPLYIKCQSENEYVAGVMKAYRHIQVDGSASKEPVVILFSKIVGCDIDTLITAMIKEGVKVTSYFIEEDTKDLEDFLNSPEGVLITEDSNYSGMESKHIIALELHNRGDLLRAIQTLIHVSMDDLTLEQAKLFEVLDK